jgi:hypothetical protein
MLNSFAYVLTKQKKGSPIFLKNYISKLPKKAQKSSIFARKSPF